MYIPFEEMSSTARVWIYQSDRQFTEAESRQVAQACEAFLNQWAAHGSPLKSSFTLVHDKFLVIAVDESFNAASGCSIDASVGLVKQLEKDFQVNFFDRTKVAFLLQGEIFQTSMNDLKELVGQGKIKPDTVTFNNLVQTVGQFEGEWQVPAGQTWLKRYF